MKNIDENQISPAQIIGTSDPDKISEPLEKEKDSNLEENKGQGPLLDENDSRNGDLTQERLNKKDENIYEDIENPDEIEKALESDELDNETDNLDDINQSIVQRTVSEKEQPLDEVIRRNGDSIDPGTIMKTVRSENDSRIIHASDGRGSKETTNGVLETPPPEDSEELNADMAAVEVNPKNKNPRVFYSDKSESSVESMMGDTPSNYNILNGRFEEKTKRKPYGSLLDKYTLGSHRDKSNIRKQKLDIISEIPSKPPSNLNTIKHVKTTKNERTFVDSVVGSDKNSYMGDMIAGSLYAGKAAGSEREQLSDNYPSQKTYDIRSKSKSNLHNEFPSQSLGQSKKIHRDLKYNQFMKSNRGSEKNSGLDEYNDKSYENEKSSQIDPVMKKEIRAGLPPIRYPKLKNKSTKSQLGI